MVLEKTAPRGSASMTTVSSMPRCATLAAAAMRAGLTDEYVLATAPVSVGSGTPFFTALDNWVNLTLVETRTRPDGVVLTRYETRH